MKQENFDELLKQRLNGSEVAPPDALWSRIESSMAQLESGRAEDAPPLVALRRPKRKLNRRTVWGYVAAASVLIAVMVVGLNRGADDQMIAEANTVVENAVGTVDLPTVKTEQVSDVVSNVLRSAVTQPIRTHSLAMTTKLKDAVVDTTINQTPDSTEIETNTVSPAEPIEKVRKSEVDNQPKNRVTHNVFAEQSPSKHKRGGMGAAIYATNFGTGSSVNSSGGGAMRSSLAVNESVNVPGGLTPNVLRSPIPALKHKMPVSYGVSVSYDFGRRLSVESGLVYTKLYSEASSSGSFDFDYKIKQNLHYLGIPLAIRYKIVKKSLFLLYLKGGAMAEMAINANRTEIISGVRASSKIDVNGVQASINGAFGAQLNITKGLGLYVEPGATYYFDCGQPDNYRTENPVNFALTAGLRINIR